MITDLEKFMPHKAPMLLLDRVIQSSPDGLTAGVTISEKSFGFENNSVPSWFGIEYMAQAIAAFNGLNFATPGGKPEIGFLVGVRNYQIQTDRFELGSELEISVAPNFVANNSGSFDCKLKLNGQDVAEAIITTYKPNQEFIENLKGGKHE